MSLDNIQGIEQIMGELEDLVSLLEQYHVPFVISVGNDGDAKGPPHNTVRQSGWPGILLAKHPIIHVGVSRKDGTIEHQARLSKDNLYAPGKYVSVYDGMNSKAVQVSGSSTSGTIAAGILVTWMGIQSPYLDYFDGRNPKHSDSFGQAVINVLTLEAYERNQGLPKQPEYHPEKDYGKVL